MTMYGARCSACHTEGCAIDRPYDDWRCRRCRTRARRRFWAWSLLGAIVGLLVPVLVVLVVSIVAATR